MVIILYDISNSYQKCQGEFAMKLKRIRQQKLITEDKPKKELFFRRNGKLCCNRELLSLATRHRINAAKYGLTQSELKELLHYDPDTGLFTWLKTEDRHRAGDIAGHVDDGYICIVLQRKNFKAHRLVWLYIHGYFPENQIDHLNGIRSDNRIENLREVSPVCNQQNCKVYKNNKTGFPGVSFAKQEQKYVAYIRLNQKLIHLGYYRDKLNAALARLTVEVQCDRWKCNHRSEIVRAIKREWPAFNPKCLD
jgi:hypothetical protein